jgi:hypothetical protein
MAGSSLASWDRPGKTGSSWPDWMHEINTGAIASSFSAKGRASGFFRREPTLAGAAVFPVRSIAQDVAGPAPADDAVIGPRPPGLDF